MRRKGWEKNIGEGRGGLLAAPSVAAGHATAAGCSLFLAKWRSRMSHRFFLWLQTDWGTLVSGGQRNLGRSAGGAARSVLRCPLEYRVLFRPTSLAAPAAEVIITECLVPAADAAAVEKKAPQIGSTFRHHRSVRLLTLANERVTLFG